ncbi:thioesterase II family protein [Streptomyces bacillaris]|uniref:thioesterase II family protein n=1 Tax=Streptomyces bacillaris TaxID=68179 RepID=UPI003820AF30
MKLLCLPHAGGTASRYHRWTSLVPPHIDIVPLELDGRGDRMSQGFYASFAEALDDLTRRAVTALEPGDSFAIFGHSMGAYLALELERRLESLGLRADRLFLSGRGTPDYRHVLSRPVGELSDQELIAGLDVYGGLPDAIARHELMRTLFLPIIRADFHLLEDGARSIDEYVPVRSPLTILNGKDDVSAQQAPPGVWEALSASGVEFRSYAGGHFFVDENMQSIIELIAEKTKRGLEKDGVSFQG